MSAQAVTLSTVYLVAADDTETQAIELSATLPADDLAGSTALGPADVDGAGAVAVAVAAYPVADVSGLDPATVGAELIAALGGV